MVTSGQIRPKCNFLDVVAHIVLEREESLHIIPKATATVRFGEGSSVAWGWLVPEDLTEGRTNGEMSRSFLIRITQTAKKTLRWFQRRKIQMVERNELKIRVQRGGFKI